MKSTLQNEWQVRWWKASKEDFTWDLFKSFCSPVDFKPPCILASTVYGFVRITDLEIKTLERSRHQINVQHSGREGMLIANSPSSEINMLLL